MRIALVTPYFPPRPSAGANRLCAFARGLKAQNVNVSVYAPRFGDDRVETTDAEVASITTWRPYKSVRRESYLLRFLDETRICIGLLQEARSKEPDVILVTSPFLSGLLFAPLLVDRKRLVFDIRDLTWEYPNSGGLIFKPLQWLLGLWARSAIRRASMIVVSTEAEFDYVVHRHLNSNVVLISNGVEDVFISAMEAASSMVHGGETASVTYVGTVGRAQGVKILVEAARAMPAVNFNIVGDGDELAEIREGGSALFNLHTHGYVSRSLTQELYARSRVLFLRLRAGFGTAVPSKVYEYVAVGCPVVYMGKASDAAWRRLQEFDGVFLAEDGSIQSLVTALGAALEAPAPRAGRNREILRRKYTREAQAAALAHHINNHFGNLGHDLVRADSTWG